MLLLLLTQFAIISGNGVLGKDIRIQPEMDFKVKYPVWCTAIILALIPPVQGRASERLFNYLFDTTRYDKRIIPSSGMSTPLNLSIALSLFQIENLDEKRQVLISHIVLTLEWIDPHLVWNPSDYDDTKYIDVHARNVWTPDIVLYNSVKAEKNKGVWRSKLKLQHNGSIRSKIPEVIHTSCRTDVAKYPFDKQECSLKITSWAYHGFHLAIHIKEDNSSNYVKSGEWELEEVSVERNSAVFGCCPEPYYDITYTVKLRRQVLYYAMYYIIPCTLIALLTTIIFVLPQDCSERITVGMCAVVGLSFFFLLVSENMPVSSRIPIIGGYYTVTLIQMGISFFMNIVVLRFHHMTEDPVPVWVRKFILGYAASLLKGKLRRNSGKEITNSPKRHGAWVEQDKEEYRFPEEILQVDEKIVEEIEEHNKGVRRDIEWKEAAHVLNSWALIIHVLMVLLAFAALFFEVLFISDS